MFITLQAMRLFKLSRSAHRVLAARALDYGDFFIRHFLFHGRKEVFPITTQQYYDFQKLVIVKVLNYLI